MNTQERLIKIIKRYSELPKELDVLGEQTLRSLNVDDFDAIVVLSACEYVFDVTIPLDCLREISPDSTINQVSEYIDNLLNKTEK